MGFVEFDTPSSERRHMEKMHNVSGMLFARVSGRPLFVLFLRAGLHPCHQLDPVVQRKPSGTFQLFAVFTDATASMSVVAGPSVNVAWERRSPQRSRYGRQRVYVLVAGSMPT